MRKVGSKSLRGSGLSGDPAASGHFYLMGAAGDPREGLTSLALGYSEQSVPCSRRRQSLGGWCKWEQSRWGQDLRAPAPQPVCWAENTRKRQEHPGRVNVCLELGLPHPRRSSKNPGGGRGEAVQSLTSNGHLQNGWPATIATLIRFKESM